MRKEDRQRILDAWAKDLEDTNCFESVKAGGCQIAADDLMLRIADGAYYPSTEQLLERMRRD